MVVDEGQVIGGFELSQVYLGLNLENAIDLGIRANIKAYHGVWNDLPSIFVPDIWNGCDRHIALIAVDHDILLRVYICGELPPLLNVPSSFHIDGMLQASIVESIVVDAVTAIVLLHTGCLQNRLLLQLVGAFSKSLRKCEEDQA